MVSLQTMQRIYLLQRLNEPMLRKVQPLLERVTFQEHETIFEHHHEADNFYMLLSGKVLLKVKANEAMSISLGSVLPGYSFGWSAMMENQQYTSTAVAGDTCEALMASGDDLLDLMNDDSAMGYRIMRSVSRILENRLRRRTQQFLAAFGQQIELVKVAD